MTSLNPSRRGTTSVGPINQRRRHPSSGLRDDGWVDEQLRVGFAAVVLEDEVVAFDAHEEIGEHEEDQQRSAGERHD